MASLLLLWLLMRRIFTTRAQSIVIEEDCAAWGGVVCSIFDVAAVPGGIVQLNSELQEPPQGTGILDSMMTDEHGPSHFGSCILCGLSGLCYGIIDYYVTACIRATRVIYLQSITSHPLTSSSPEHGIYHITRHGFHVYPPRK